MIDPTLKNINRLFVLPFKNDILDPKKYSCDECYMPSKEIDGFNPLIDNKTILEHFVEKNKKRMKSLLKIQEIMVLQEETYQIFCIVKNIRNSLVFNCQNKQIQAFPQKNIFWRSRRRL